MPNMPTPRRDTKPRPRPTCNVPDCPETTGLHRGLCTPRHWDTHRGLADPDPQLDDHPKVAMP